MAPVVFAAFVTVEVFRAGTFALADEAALVFVERVPLAVEALGTRLLLAGAGEALDLPRADAAFEAYFVADSFSVVVVAVRFACVALGCVSLVCTWALAGLPRFLGVVVVACFEEARRAGTLIAEEAVLLVRFAVGIAVGAACCGFITPAGPSIAACAAASLETGTLKGDEDT